MMPLKDLLKNKLLLQKHYHVQESYMDTWPFWMLEENISIVNEITEEEDRKQKEAEKQQQGSMPNFDPGQYMKNISGMTDKFKP